MENVDKIHGVIIDDQRVATRHITNILGIYYDRVQAMLRNELDITKVSVSWVRRFLITDPKGSRFDFSNENLRRFEADSADVERFAIMDEFWVHHHQPETKQQSKQWKHLTSSPPKKVKPVPSAGKVIALVFWDCKGIPMETNGQIINDQYVSNLPRLLRENIETNHRRKRIKCVLFHLDNASVHKYVVIIAAMHGYGFEQP
ncbi:uncharacterized protein LOC121384048 [Gigantopelta aegis]|uniref:uncharacterized protein LOC121384048 n=1 Tax=Gigantopelta aegis TaxID=1735272 RepID=UPI001B88E072|nr:uncharacterized protein LOC121384048 [Gigantopelta aegis]